MTNRKLLTILAVFALAAVLVAGCSGSTTPANGNGGADKAQVVKPTIILTATVSEDKKTVTFTGILKNGSDKDLQNFRVLELRTSPSFDKAMGKAASTQDPKIEDVTKQVVKAKSELKITWTYTNPEPLKDDSLKAYAGSVFTVLYKADNGDLVGVSAKAD